MLVCPSAGSGRTQQGQETRRYRKAAGAALEQLDWCVSYLHRIQRRKIAEALRRNRTTIVKRHRL
jgi:hypothetical protein